MIASVIVVSLLEAVILARLILYWCTDASPEQRYCACCRKVTCWRPEIGCELCQGAVDESCSAEPLKLPLNYS